MPTAVKASWKKGMETDSSSACAASTTNSPGTGRRDTPSVRRVSPPGLRGDPFLRTGSHHRGRPTRDVRSRPRLCGNSIEHCLPRNDVLGQAHLCKFVPMRAATGRPARKPFFTNSGNKSFHAASAHKRHSSQSLVPHCGFGEADIGFVIHQCRRWLALGRDQSTERMSALAISVCRE